MSSNRARRSRGREGAQDGGGDDEEEEIQYGFRRARRDTSYHYRDSSSLSPAQMMEREACYQFAMDILNELILMIQIMSLVFTMHTRNQAILRRLLIIGDAVAGQIAAAQARIQYFKDKMETLIAIFTWLKANGELALLRAEDLSIFIRRKNRFHPPRYRRIQDISRQDCYSWYGLSNYNLQRLFEHWRVPETLTTSSRHSYHGEECFLVMLYHMIKGSMFTDMARNIFGGDPRRLSDMNELMIHHLYMTFYNKISRRSLEQWVPTHVHLCRELIHSSLASGALEEVVYENGEEIDRHLVMHHFELNSFRPFGFLDDFAMPTARPGSLAQRSLELRHDIQRSFYSGYLRRHGLKAQVVYLPIGIIGSVFITELRQNDNGVQNISGLNDYLCELLQDTVLEDGDDGDDNLLPALYCDGIFAVLETILPRFTNPTAELHQLNMRMASARQIIEHVFGDHRTRFKLFSVPHTLHLFDQGVKVRKMCLVSFFILNCFYCIDGTRCRYFGHIAPTLEDYIPLDEELAPPPAVDLGNVWDYSGSQQ